MSKRFTDTKIWKNQRWFKNLKPVYKLAWKYITDQCNYAGVWKIDCSDLMEDIGIEEFNFDDFIESCNKEFDKMSGKKIKRERLKIVKDHLWITGFVQFQYENKAGSVPRNNPIVLSAMEILKGFNLYNEAMQKKYINFD